MIPALPFVLDEVDYVLLGDGVKLEVRKMQAQPGRLRFGCAYLFGDSDRFIL